MNADNPLLTIKCNLRWVPRKCFRCLFFCGLKVRSAKLFWTTFLKTICERLLLLVFHDWSFPYFHVTKLIYVMRCTIWYHLYNWYQIAQRIIYYESSTSLWPYMQYRFRACIKAWTWLITKGKIFVEKCRCFFTCYRAAHIKVSEYRVFSCPYFLVFRLNMVP